MKMPNPDDFIKHSSVAEHAAHCAGLPVEPFDWKKAFAQQVLEANLTAPPPMFIAMDPAKKGASTDCLATYADEADGLKLIDFKLTNNLPTKIQGKSWADLSKDFTISGEIETTFIDEGFFTKLAAKTDISAWKELYESKWEPEPFDGLLPKYLHKDGGISSFTGPAECRRPAEPDISVPPLSPLERSHPKLAMQAIFTRILTVTRRQRGAGFVPYFHKVLGEWRNTAMYRTPNGARCPFGYLIPDEAYHFDLEHNKASAPGVMAAMGLSAFRGSKPFREFLDAAQLRLHDEIASRSGFMFDFENAARSFARKHKLVYHNEGMAREAWAR